MGRLMMWDLMTLDGFVEGENRESHGTSTSVRSRRSRGCRAAEAGKCQGYLAVRHHRSRGDFIRQGLIDECRIGLCPIVLGQGTPLFKPGMRNKLKLLDSRSLSSGAVILRYVPAQL
jgi:hypothetical protein